MFMVLMSISRGIISMNGPGGRHGASSVCAVRNSMFSVHTAYRWERKKPPHSATAACRNRKGQVLHSFPTPRYLQWNLGDLRRLKLFLIYHYQAQRGDAQSPSKEVQASPSSVLTTTALPASVELLWDLVEPLLCLWAGSGEQQSSDQKWLGKQLGPVQGGGHSTGVGVGCLPCLGHPEGMQGGQEPQLPKV